MQEKFDSPPVPSAIQRIASAFRITGWIGFWVQLVLSVVSTLIFLFAIPSAGPRAGGGGASNPGTGGSIFFAVCGLLVLYFSIYQAFRYTRLGLHLKDSNPNLRPKKADAIKVLRFGLTVSLVGLLLAVVGAEAITGTLLAKSLSQAQGGVAIYDPQFINRLIQPLDIFVVLANTHTITAHVAGVIVSLWLLSRVNKQ
ncbi:DUF3611 family protein [Funiculus sociatus GB2-A5]|uniref:DUF3611 family protein n=1 Tax=Funiculus sociatus GB2-A5 TaxID=2933946 RepID=A0ABV0JL32_9CYAN|nr:MULTISPECIES: DUF3611 family protein [unclassified Trichocoleus]MBD1907055.1 DUF3611 family protein [Trichocoleus sp. FACHB-832]MBD2063540.1 DUF3611 family protein [Trichocoleus sp. FACHB-6]